MHSTAPTITPCQSAHVLLAATLGAVTGYGSYSLYKNNISRSERSVAVKWILANISKWVINLTASTITSLIVNTPDDFNSYTYYFANVTDWALYLEDTDIKEFTE